MSDLYYARKARSDDVSTLIALRAEAERWLEERGIVQWTPEWDEVGRAKIRENVERDETWVFEKDAHVVATVTLNTRPDLDFWQPTDGPALYLYKLIVAREVGSTALGAKILNWSTDRAAKAGFPWLRLDLWRSNQGLKRYYVTQGFQHVRTVTVPGRDSGACYQRPAAATATPEIVELPLDSPAMADDLQPVDHEPPLGSRWGPWQINRQEGILFTTVHDYAIELSKCKTPEEILDGICQVANKSWADDATLAGLVRALDEVITPTGNRRRSVEQGAAPPHRASTLRESLTGRGGQ